MNDFKTHFFIFLVKVDQDLKLYRLYSRARTLGLWPSCLRTAPVTYLLENFAPVTLDKFRVVLRTRLSRDCFMASRLVYRFWGLFGKNCTLLFCLKSCCLRFMIILLWPSVISQFIKYVTVHFNGSCQTEDNQYIEFLSIQLV